MSAIRPAKHEAPATADGALPQGDGVVFPAIDGERSTTRTGRAVLADAARAADPGLADRIDGARHWRGEYVGCVRDLTAATGRDAAASTAVAEAGLASLRARMEVDRDGAACSLTDAVAAEPALRPGTRVIEGAAEPAAELAVPYGDQVLRGAALRAQLDRWVDAGVVEPSFAAAIGRVAAHPEWLSVPGRRIALLGAAAEMGPLDALCAWGADVIAVDLPGDARWRRIQEAAERGAGTVTIPTGADGAPGLDLIRALPEARAWIDRAAGDEQLVLGTYAYADGGTHVRVTAAADALAEDLLDRRPDTALGWLGTPTDAYVVPEDVMAHARAAYGGRRLRRVAQAPVQAVSRGRLFTPAYADGDAVADALVPQQGPNYALAKRAQRWRAVLARRAGHTVSFNVAPASWTRSVTSNRVLAAAYAGARRFGIEIFRPETCRVLMAAMLVHDLHHAPADDRHPEALFSDGAAHGGLWRAAYEPRSVLGIAAVAGALGAVRRPG